MSSNVKWGVIAAVGLTGSFSTMLSTASKSSPTMQLIYLAMGILILAVSIFIGLRSIKTKHGELTMEKGIRGGLQMVVISSLLTALLLYFYLAYINPTVIENYRALLTEGVMASGQSKKEISEQLMAIEQINSPYQIVKYFLPRVILSGATFVIVSTFLLRKLNF